MLGSGLKNCHLHPLIPPGRVPQMQRAQASPADRLLFQILAPGLKGVLRNIPPDIKDGRSTIALYRYCISLKPRNPQGELRVLRDRVMHAALPDLCCREAYGIAASRRCLDASRHKGRHAALPRPPIRVPRGTSPNCRTASSLGFEPGQLACKVKHESLGVLTRFVIVVKPRV